MWVGGLLLLALMLAYAWGAGAAKGIKAGYEAAQKEFYADAV